VRLTRLSVRTGAAPAALVDSTDVAAATTITTDLRAAVPLEPIRPAFLARAARYYRHKVAST
jgi:hypothetical protein